MMLKAINIHKQSNSTQIDLSLFQQFLIWKDQINPILTSELEKDKNLCMEGKIRTKEICPECGRKFEDIGWTLICREHFTAPKRYFIDIYWQGKRRKIYSDNDGRVFKSYELAKRVLTEIRQKIDKHKFDPADYIAKRYISLQFDTYAREWINRRHELHDCGEMSICTIRNTKYPIEKLAVSFFKSKDIRDIKTGDIEDFYFSLPKEMAQSTKYEYMNKLHALFVAAKRRHDIKVIPDFPGNKTGEQKTIWLDKKTQDLIYQNIANPHKPIFLFMMRQAVRPSEARALRWEDIDLKNRTITICRSFSDNEYKKWTKTKNIRVLPLDDDVYKMLKNLNRIGGFVFTQKDGSHYKYRQIINTIWKKAVKSAGLQHISPYIGTRHSKASQAANNGIPLNIIQDFLGHKDPSTTRRYAHLDTRGMKIMVEKEAKVIKMNKAVPKNCPQTVPRKK